jgi:site-specific recombinase XerD
MNKVSNQNLARRTMTLSKGTSEMLKLYSQGHRQLDKLFKTKYWPFWHRFKLTSQKVFGHPYTTPHFMRASSAVFLISKGLDLNTVAELGGWNSLNSMKLYLKESGVTSANVMNRLNLDWEATKQPEQKMLVEALS